jgi:DNA-directed RNA polymerase subunit RPC12/RpoP
VSDKKYDGAEVVRGVVVAEDGSVYISDAAGEIVCWVPSEFEDPQALIAAFTGVAMAAREGPEAVRANLADGGETLAAMMHEVKRGERLWQYQCMREGTIFYYQHAMKPHSEMITRCPMCGSKRLRRTRVFPGVRETSDVAEEALTGKRGADVG